MRKTLCTLLLLLLCLNAGFSAFRAEAEAEADTDAPSGSFRVVIASDLHYIAPELTDGGDCYQRVLKNGDSKFMPYIEEITEAFLDEVLAERPDAVLLTGDLSFNGAEESHLALREKLRRLEDAGIPVLVLPGNHDVWNVNAARFRGDGYELVPFTSSEGFAEIYREFGFGEALAADPDSLSYVFPLGEKARVMMLDENTIHDFCGLSAQSLAWIETQLRAAREAGCFVLVAGHQNLFRHSVFRDGYVIRGAEEVAALLREYKIPLCLSGHLHIQHMQTENGLTEITTSALCSYPYQYAVLTREDGHLHYETRRLDLAAWALRSGRGDAVFGRFAEAAGEYMDAHFTPNATELSVADPALRAEMLSCLQAMNRAYFSGDLREIAALDPDGDLASLWMREGGLTAEYLQSILRQAGTDHRVWDSNTP